jgi:SAM-dependent methyltransferase
MFAWRKASPDPTLRDSFKAMDAFLSSITQIHARSRVELILDFVRGQTVLDIGAGEHDPSFFSPSWEHGQIKSVAAKAVAVEINPDLCAHYNAKGFDFRCVDATSDADLGERFTRVFAGDVIEHVNNPVRLLQFIKRHLEPGGRALLTTPNPFAPRFRETRRKFGTRYVATNLEHTCWITPSNMHELAWRAGLTLRALHWPLLKKPRRGLRDDIALTAARMRLAMASPESLFHEYAYELSAD